MTEPQRRRDWEERYAVQAVWTGNVNAHLKDWVRAHHAETPGAVIDLGCGEGGDAIWLAERGWRVTGVDFALSAISRAAAAARNRGADVTWIVADSAEWHAADPADLVSVAFLHEPPSVRTAVWRNAARAVAPGGTLLVAGHAPGEEGAVGPPAASRFAAEEVIAVVDQTWRCDVHEVHRDGVGRHAGHGMIDVVIALTRPASH